MAAEIPWIDHRGYCAGPHPEIYEKKWRFPQGRTAIRKFIKSNGVTNFELVCTVRGCRFNTSPIPNAAAEQLLERLPILPTRYASQVGRHTCCYDGCDSTEIEWHHFAPRNTFGIESERFPIHPLCREHHRYWHQTMDGYRWHRRNGQWQEA